MYAQCKINSFCYIVMNNMPYFLTPKMLHNSTQHITDLKFGCFCLAATWLLFRELCCVTYSGSGVFGGYKEANKYSTLLSNSVFHFLFDK